MRSMWVGMGLFVGASALGLVACGGDSATSATTAISVRPTNYVTIPPAPSTTAPVTTAVDAPGAILPYETTYTIAQGDLPVTIASKWAVDFNALMALNSWVLEGTGSTAYVSNFPPVGTAIKIPPGATVPGEPVAGAAPDNSVATTTATTTATSAAPTTVAEAEGEVCGAYTITADDTSRVKVADKFDTTVAKLDAVNASTNGYGGFYAGLEIKIPC